jgi:acetyltransferase-like isoleucine patch superfamily enzyme
MKLSIVLVGEAVPDLLDGLQRLVPVVDGLEADGLTVETVVVAYAGEPDIDALAAAVEGATFVRPPLVDGTILERWRTGAAMATGDVLWLLASGNEYDRERFADHLAVLDKTVHVAYDDCQLMLRRAAVELLHVDPRTTQFVGYSGRDAVAAVVEHARRRRLRAVEVPLALPAEPFVHYPSSELLIREWTGATVYEGAPGVVRAGRHSAADVGTVIRTWAPFQHVIIGDFTYFAAGVHVANPSHGNGPAERVGPHGLRPHTGHNVNLATIGQMYLHVPAVQHRYASAVRVTPLVIGHDVWVGSRATIVGDLTIGNGAVIGAGAVVLGDIPPYAVVEGNPAKVVRMRFSPSVIESLLRINWWDWDESTIAARADWFTRPIAEFCNRFDPVRRKAMLGALGEATALQQA